MGGKLPLHSLPGGLESQPQWRRSQPAIPRRLGGSPPHQREHGFYLPRPAGLCWHCPTHPAGSAGVYRHTLRNDFRLTLSYHAQGKLIYWRYLDYLPPRSEEIAQAMGEASGYSVEETPSLSGYAGYKDWFIQTYDRPGYTIEVGQGTSPLPLSQFDGIYADNLGILVLGLALAARPPIAPVEEAPPLNP